MTWPTDPISEAAVLHRNKELLRVQIREACIAYHNTARKRSLTALQKHQRLEKYVDEIIQDILAISYHPFVAGQLEKPKTPASKKVRS